MPACEPLNCHSGIRCCGITEGTATCGSRLPTCPRHMAITSARELSCMAGASLEGRVSQGGFYRALQSPLAGYCEPLVPVQTQVCRHSAIRVEARHFGAYY